jgi:glycosyltransferase involved in cell wall biosynthesis
MSGIDSRSASAGSDTAARREALESPRAPAAATAPPERLPALCLVGPLPPPSGGMANQCEQLARLLAAEGMAVEVVRNNADYRPRWAARLPGLRALFRLLPYLAALWRAARRAQAMHVMANSGWAWHLFAAPAIWIARYRGVPVIVNYRGGHLAAFLDRAPFQVLPTLRMAAALVTPSGFLQRVFAQHGLRAAIVPNIVDLSRFQFRPPRPAVASPHLVVTRNLEPIYDIPTAVRAFAEVRRIHPDARLTVAGTGPELTRLRALADELGLAGCVAFTGRIDNADIPDLYETADCMLNPSTVDNMPISLLEAFASGVPVVSTNAGGIPDIATDGHDALLVPVGDARRMAEAALRVLAEPALAERLSAAARTTVAAFAWPAVRSQWFDLYRRIARKTR